MNTAPRYAVFGNPVAHSKSPQIHRQFALQEGVEIEYERICADIGGFAQAVEAFFADGGRGANDTLILLENGKIRGDNTDGIGLTDDISKRLGVELSGKTVLLLGAGGAVRGVIPVLKEYRPARIVIANRTHAKAAEMAAHFDIDAVPLEELEGGFDIIINGTSGGLSGQLPAVSPKIFEHCTLAYDMVYGEAAEPFLAFARQSGAKQTADGLGMLVGQAAASYRLWRGFAPDVLPVVQYMREL